MVKENLGELLSRLMLEKNLTVQDLSELTHISRVELNYIIINKVKKPSVNTIYKLSKALDYDYMKLYDASLIV
ncbi:helix-turn-helix domain-containing protein [Mammaliicoccus vitulinus]|uniref:helix-turn-helix domain-containing protein n=1 Tax=Mammaliicoccus vitulinus TaxID=71237 RepID=UPI00248B21F4|nr:helix-turn-helix transcriptional regulator [Mammaliicoccus vitulinus]